jgi:hypothetical protein
LIAVTITPSLATVHPHMFRHACGYKLANDGRDTRALQHYLGHKSIQHTVRYTKLSPDRFRDFWRERLRRGGLGGLYSLPGPNAGLSGRHVTLCAAKFTSKSRRLGCPEVDYELETGRLLNPRAQCCDRQARRRRRRVGPLGAPVDGVLFGRTDHEFRVLSQPTTGIARCCARAASGHAVAPPTVVMKSRRRRQMLICPSRLCLDLN